ncbi:MAG TPA: hypothetical protein VEB23_01485 [Ramlibacter sp.]|nr:hypothetical protein [Ramlibacter sp.]
MDTTTFSRAQQDRPIDFLLLVDFKWLMAGQGRWVNLTRLQHDAAYADDCIASALASACEPLRERAVELQACGTDLVPAH